MLVREWIQDFLTAHGARFQPYGWPRPGSEEYLAFAKGWMTEFALKAVTQDEAEVASTKLMGCPPRHMAEHLPAVMQLVLLARAEAAPAAETREAAREQSRGCRYCGGEGLATVYNVDPCHAAGRPESVAAHCTCPHGRFIRAKVAEGKETKAILRRIPDLAEVLSGRARDWRANPPEYPDVETRRQYIHGPAHFVLDSARRWVPNPEYAASIKAGEVD